MSAHFYSKACIRLAEFYGVSIDYLLGVDRLYNRKKDEPISKKIKTASKLWQLENKAEKGNSIAQAQLNIINGILDHD